MGGKQATIEPFRNKLSNKLSMGSKGAWNSDSNQTPGLACFIGGNLYN